MFKRQAGLTLAAIAAMAAGLGGVDPGVTVTTTRGISPYTNHTGHAGHWQGHQGQNKVARRRAAKKDAHASRVRNRPKKVRKHTDRVPLAVKIKAKKDARIARMDPGPITGFTTTPLGFAGGDVVAAP